MFACCQPLWSFALVADNASGTPLGTPLGNPPQFIVCAARELRWMLPWGLHWGLPWGLPRGITPNSFLRGTRCVRTILPRGLPKFICARCALCFGCSPAIRGKSAQSAPARALYLEELPAGANRLTVLRAYSARSRFSALNY